MRTFAIVNRKGGVGKTTTAVNLAYVLATSCHLRVLLVDADGQANATQILLPRGEYDGLGALMRGMAICYDELVVHTDVEGLDVLPASEDLWALDLEAAGGEGGRSYRTLRDMREAVEEDGAYDVMVIDCPPNLSAACVSAILASDAVIIPVLSDACSATGVADLMEQIDSLRYIRPEIRVAGVLVNQWHRSPVVEDAAAYLREDGRGANGLGCLRRISDKCTFGITDDLLRDILTGNASPTIKEWREIGRALDELEGRGAASE